MKDDRQATPSPSPIHDLNNHMAAAKGYIELLRRSDTMTEEDQHLVERAHEALRRALQLTRKLDLGDPTEKTPPRPPPALPSELEEIPEQALHGVETLLVVEDDQAFREMLESFLTRKGYTVQTASDGNEGLQLLETQQDEIDAVLVDRFMPNCDGMEFIEKMRLVAPRMRALLLSGNDLRVEEDLLRKHQVSATLKKPFPLKLLAKILRDTLDALPPSA